MQFKSNYRKASSAHSRIIGDASFPVSTIVAAMNKIERGAYIFCRWDNLLELPKPKSVIVWIKNNWSMGDLKHEHGRQWEACCFYPSEKHQFIKRIPDVIHADRTGNDYHPTEKPVALIEKLIACNVCSTVFDPYMGSGTTLFAARNLGRDAVGIEIEEKYCEIAARGLQGLPVVCPTKASDTPPLW